MSDTWRAAIARSRTIECTQKNQTTVGVIALTASSRSPVKRTRHHAFSVIATAIVAIAASVPSFAESKSEGLIIDFEAVGEHLYQLSIAAQKADAHVALVIFDPVLRTGATSKIRSVYIRDPDLNLIEIPESVSA